MKPTIRRTLPHPSRSGIAVSAVLDARAAHGAARERSMFADVRDPLRFERWLGRLLWLGLVAVLLYIGCS